MIAVNGVRFAHTAVQELMGTSPATTVPECIQKTTLQVNGARSVEKLVVRKVGPRLFVDMHLEVDPELTVWQGHAIAHAVKDAILAQTANVADVLVHVEPHPGQ